MIKNINVPLVVDSTTLQNDLKDKDSTNGEINVPLQTSYTGQSAPKESQYKLDEYQKYFDDGVDPVFKDINKERALNQSGWEQAGRSIGGGLYKGVLTAVEDAGYLLDVENNINRLTGLEEVDTNWMSKLATDAKESFDENHPIYRYNPEKVIDMSDPGFYWSALQGVVDSAVGFGLLGAGVGATVGKGLKGLIALTKAGLPIQNMVATVGTALTTNYAEGKMMSLELFKNSVDSKMQDFDKKSYDKAFEQAQNMNPGVDPGQVNQIAQELLGSEEFQQARQAAEKNIRSIAGDEANIFQTRNMVFMLSDALAINGMFKGVGSTRNLLKDKSIKNTMLMIAKQAPTEYVEEVGQGMMQKEGEYQSAISSGMDTEISSDPVKRAWDFFTDPQTQLEGMMGLFGGPVQHALVQAPMNLASKGSDTEYRTKQTEQVKQNEQLLNTLVGKRATIEKSKQQAIKEGNIEAFKEVINDDFADVAFRNFNAGTTENLENGLKEVAEMSPEDAKTAGYDETYKEDAEARMTQLKELESSYLKIQRKHGGEKDYLIHKSLYDLESKRNSITPIIASLKEQKATLLATVQNEVNTLEDKDISSDQMKLKDVENQIESLRQHKAKLTATKNDALRKPNVRFKKLQEELAEKKRTLVIAKKNAYKYSQEELVNRNNEVVDLQEKVNRLSQFTDKKTQNKRLTERVEKAYNKQVDSVDKQLSQLITEKDKVKVTLKENKEKINSFNTKDYSKWEDLAEVQSNLNNFTTAKKLYDSEQSRILNDKSAYIKEIEKAIKENKISSTQKELDNATTPEAKKEIINKQEDPEIKSELNKRNQKDIQNQERSNRIEQTIEQSKEDFEITSEAKEEVKTTEIINDKSKQNIVDDETIEDIKNEVDGTQEHIVNENADIESVDDNGPEYSIGRVQHGYNLLAHLSRLYKTIVNGKKVGKEDIDNELNESSFIQVLNPNKYGKGTKIVLKEVNDDSTIINAETGESWGELNIVDKTSNEYINTVPIGVYDQDNNIIGYLHQDNWISEDNIFGDVKTNKEKLFKIRKKIIESDEVTTTIKYKSIGYLFRNKYGATTTGKAITDTNVIFAIGGNDKLFADQDLSKLNITNRDRINPGTTYMVVQVGSNDVDKIYTAIPLLNKRFGESTQEEQIVNSIQNAIRIHYKIATKTTNDDEQTLYKLLGSEGYDLSSLIGLKQYINQFVQVFDNDGQPIDQAAKARFTKQTSLKTLLSIDGQQIQFFYNTPVIGKKGFINVNNTTPEQLEVALDIIGKSIIPNMYINTDKQAIINSNKPVKIITSKEGKLGLQDLTPTYTDFVKENTLTDILSHKVDTDENGDDIYSYTVQPKIEIDFSNIIEEGIPLFITKDNRQQLYDLGYSKEDVGKMTAEEAIDIVNIGATKVIKETKTANQEEGYTPLEGDSMIQDTAVDLDMFPDIDFLPELEDSFVKDFQSQVSDIIIQGLDTSKQSALVDTLFKEVLVAILDNPKGVDTISVLNPIFDEIQSNLDNRLKNINEIIPKNIEYFKNKDNDVEVSNQEKLLRLNQAVAKLYETYILNKDRFVELTLNKLKSEDIIQSTGLNEEGELVDPDENNNEKIYNRSSYQENRDNRASKHIKRFLNGIRTYNQDGSIKKNILGREKLMGYNEVYQQLQAITKNIVPDYKIIKAKIESYIGTFPFLKDVITKLENESNPDIEVIRKQLTSLLTNHYSNSEFILYGQDKNGNNYISSKSSNSNSIQEAVLDGWNSTVQESDLLEVQDDGTQIINIEKATELINQLAEWKKNIPENATIEVRNWLKSFGIIMSDKAWKDLENGKLQYGKNKFNTWEQLFKSGPFNILANQYLKKQKGSKFDDGNLIVRESTVKNLASLEGKYSENFHDNSHREGTKTVYSYGTNKLVTDIVRDLTNLEKSEDSKGNEVYTNSLITDNLAMVFESESLWLNDMVLKDDKGNIQYAKNGQVIINTDSATWANLDFYTVSLEALKKQGSQSRDNRELNKLSNGEIEFGKLGFLTSTRTDQTGNNNRIIALLYPTTSDKSTTMGVNTKAVDIDFDFGTSEITQKTIDMLYNSLVLPEIQRILHINKLEKEGKDINLQASYKDGAKQFLFLSELNDPELELFNEDGTLNSNIQTESRQVIYDTIRRYIDELVADKLDIWKDAGIIKEDGSNNLIDTKFYNGFAVDNKSKGIATDMVIQYLVGNANIFQTFIGDPALYFKSSQWKKVATRNNINPNESSRQAVLSLYTKEDFVQESKDSYINIGKRLGGDIAPGEQGDGTMNNTYKQVFIKNKEIQSSVYKQLKKLLGEEKAKPYKNIDSADAQEYTTLLEKLYVMNMHGEIEMKGVYDKVYNIISKELSKKKPNTQYIKQLESGLTVEEFEYLKNLTLQPDKPVYVQNIFDKELGIKRRVYIKSSSFALSPFLTTGTELDKVRIAMETKGVSRLAYDSAVKVGNVNKSNILWNKDGSLVENIEFQDNQILTLPRTGFRIQQKIPYSRLKEVINKVSQASKNLFVNMLDVDGFSVPWYKDGAKVKGKELQKEYFKLYKQLFKNQYQELLEELDYNPKNGNVDTEKLRKILLDEAIRRDYPIADLHTFDLDRELQLLAFSPSASKYESLLNSIVTNRVIKMKFPGKSYVLGSEAGFKPIAQEDINLSDYDIVWTSKWNGKELQAADGSGRADQVIIPWDFKEDIEKYVGADGQLDLNKVPEELLQRFGMRIPNSGPNYQSKIEVAGFFKGNVGDLLIAPKEYVVRMGSDFDVDKLYIYRYDYYKAKKSGKFIKSNITKEKAEELYNKRVDSNVDILLKSMLGEEYEDIINLDKIKFVRKLTNKDTKNKILDIHLAIHSNPDQRVQSQIHQPTDFWKFDGISKKIDQFKSARSNKIFTGLSDEYQKQKFINANAGKALVGVFANDMSFNALIQGKDIALLSSDPDEPFSVQFGNKIANGDLSNPYTLETQAKIRKLEDDNELSVANTEYKSDIITGLLSSAVDNEKEQILDKLNLNSETASVAKVMGLLGFGEEIGYFLAQDIIVDYVLELRKLRGLGDFVADIENVAYANVIGRDKYKVEYDPEIHGEYGTKKLTVTKMSDMIEGKPVDNYEITQRAILDKYLALKINGRTISKVQSSLNLDSQGLGKSFFETLIREEDLNNLSAKMKNFEKLSDPNESIPGMAIEYGLKINNKIWNKYLPYNKPAFKRVFKELEKIYSKTDLGRDGKAAFRSKMWNEFKKYIFSNPNLFYKFDEQITDPNYIDDERKRLFIHTPKNTSLARYVYEAKELFPSNIFLKNLKNEVRKDGQPSKVKFQAGSKGSVNEETMYEHFADLLINKKAIVKDYDTQKLFQDLVWGAYLNGGIQEAWQYVKFIPTAYLHLIPFAEKLVEFVDNININEKFTITDNEEEYILPSVIKQIVQNVSEQLPKVTKDEWIEENDALLYNGKLMGLNNSSPYYMTMYDDTTPAGHKNFRLYEKIGEAKNKKGIYYPQYIEIPVVGTSGRDKVSEYNYLKDGYTKSIYGSKNEKSKEYKETTNTTKQNKSITGETKMQSSKSTIDKNIDIIWLSDTYKNKKITGKKVVENIYIFLYNMLQTFSLYMLRRWDSSSGLIGMRPPQVTTPINKRVLVSLYLTI